MLEVKPASVREYSIAQIRRSYWYYAGQIMGGAVLVSLGASLLIKGFQPMQLGFALLVIGIVSWAIIPSRTGRCHGASPRTG